MGTPEVNPVPSNETAALQHDIEKEVGDETVSARSSNDSKVSEDGSENKQDGVRQVEAITTVWSKQLLVVMFVLLYIVTFCDMLLQSVQGNLVPYVTSSFSQHGLLGTTGIVASIIGGVSNLAIAKVIDIWGRCEGFLAMLLLVVVGIIMKATCQNVETYAAAHTLYWVSHTGLLYVVDIILADTTSLKNRMLILGINYTPTIATTFAGPRIAELFYVNVNFRWAFGAFCIILVAFCAPVAVIFIISKRKAVRLGVCPVRTSNRTVWESCKHYFVQFDVVGMFLTIFGWSLLLLPFSLVYTAPNGWSTGYLISMIVMGFFCPVGFIVWEKWFAVVPYLPLKYLKDRTIISACFLYGIMFLSIFLFQRGAKKKAGMVRSNA